MGQYFAVCTAAIRSGHGPHYLSTTAPDNVDIDTAGVGAEACFSNVTPVSAVLRYPVAVWPLAMTNDDARGRYRLPLRLGHGDIATATTATYIWHCLYLLSKGISGKDSLSLTVLSKGSRHATELAAPTCLNDLM